MNAQRVAVMGAGTMGSGIAAHLANLGFEVTLYDLTQESAQAGLDRALRARPPHFYDQDSVKRIRLASFAEDLIGVRGADWVCEAIVENLQAKRELYEAIEPVLREDAMVTTNTSGLEIARLAEGRSASFRERFLGTHFFNPPRYLKLIELIPTDDIAPDAVASMTRFLEDRVGRRVVIAKDTPGFIANRFGMWALYQAIHTAERLNFSVETVDAVTGPFIGRPRTATFRLADLIGLDIMDDVANNLLDRCQHDPQKETLRTPSSVAELLRLGWKGSKAGQGYYKKEGDQFLSLDFRTDSYRPRVEPHLPGIGPIEKLPLSERLRQALELTGEAGEYLREHLPATLLYAAEIGPEISYSVRDFDDVMKWGWGWSSGPFELIDEIGYDVLQRYTQSCPLQDKLPFYREGAALNLSSMKHEPILRDKRFATAADFPTSSEGANWVLRDDGAGGFIFSFNSKMNALAPDIVAALIEHLKANPNGRITLANDGRAFSAGFDLGYFLANAEEARFEEIQKTLELLQECGRALNGCESAAAVQGFSLGGGMELAMHCRTVVAHPEAALGLPEVLVGLIPAGGGTALMRKRTQGSAQAMCAAAVAIASGRKISPTEAKKIGHLRPADTIAANPDAVISGAVGADRPAEKAVAWAVAPAPLGGMIDNEIDKLRASGEIGEYGATLAAEVKKIFVKASSEQHALEMEIEAFLSLLGKHRTIMRIRHMLEKGKPLNN
jgi:3-hydroxyacyl-CoA dehydrogenase